MLTTDDVRAWAEKRQVEHRTALEVMSTDESRTIGLRHRLAELKELLAALENKVPPVWIDAPD